MNVLFIFILFISIIYLFYFVFLFSALFQKKEVKPTVRLISGISVIVPFRNERENIVSLLNSLQAQTYKNFEVIFINDHSSDGGEELILKAIKTSERIKIISLPENKKGKKMAIELGINNATFDFILTTDADCIFDEVWIEKHVTALSSGIDFCGGPVGIIKANSFLSLYQEFEFMVLSGLSYSSLKIKMPLIISGANLSFSKNLFFSVKPFQNNEHIASGDDIYFLQKSKKLDVKMDYLLNHETMVKTQKVSFEDFISQRVRWMKKSTSLKDFSTAFTGILLSLNSILFVFCAVYQIVNQEINDLLMFSMAIKIGIDILFLFLVTLRLKGLNHFWFFPFALVMNLIFTSFFFVFGWFIPITWKGRNI